MFKQNPCQTQPTISESPIKHEPPRAAQNVAPLASQSQNHPDCSYFKLFQAVSDNISPRSDQMFETCHAEFENYLKRHR